MVVAAPNRPFQTAVCSLASTDAAGVAGHCPFYAALLTVTLSVSLLIWPLSLRAAIELELGSLSGPGWSLSQLRVLVPVDDSPLLITATELTLAQPLGRISDLELRCGGYRLGVTRISCVDGTLTVSHPWFQAPLTGVQLDYLPIEGKGSLEVGTIQVAGSDVGLKGRLQGEDWWFELEADALDLARIGAYGARLLPAAVEYSLAAGTARLKMTASGSADTRWTLELSAAATGLAAADTAGLLELDGVDLRLETKAEGLGREWRSHHTVAVERGSIYVDPVYVEATPGRPLQLTTDLRTTAQGMSVSGLSYTHPQVMKLTGELQVSIQPWQLRGIRIDANMEQIGDAYETYLQPFLTATAGGGLDLSGWARAGVEYRSGALQKLYVRAEALDIADREGLYGFSNLFADVAWAASGSPQTSRIAWDSASLYSIPLGASQALIDSVGGELVLARPLHLPLLDGAVDIGSLQTKGLLSQSPSWSLQAQVSAVSLERLTAALDWPPMAGDLSGMIPRARYFDSAFEIDGALLARVFGGDITVTGLRIEEPLGVVPRLQAEVDLHNLDLLALTRTFSFGRMEGKVEGYVHDLELVGWEPVRFDAIIRSIAKPAGRRRISQRAVEGLSSLGGGGAAALSSGFLKLFDEFRYKRLGLGCRLENGVCRMRGVGSARQGYYLVEGSGLPRIDVIGHAAEVDWVELVSRLKAATRSTGPVIE